MRAHTSTGTGEGNAPRDKVSVSHRDEATRPCQSQDTGSVHPARLGRGSHPNSRKNLKPQEKKYAVYSRGTDGTWHQLSRVTTYKTAYKWARILEERNGTNRKPMYVATHVIDVSI